MRSNKFIFFAVVKKTQKEPIKLSTWFNKPDETGVRGKDIILIYATLAFFMFISFFTNLLK